jgi:RNA polymerase sigma factor (TIGR02999 family)
MFVCRPQFSSCFNLVLDFVVLHGKRQMEGEAVTQLLLEWGAGDRDALDRLLPVVFDELRRLAHAYLRRERADHTLQPTALVNEAYLRLVDQRSVRWQNRAQFFGIAANLMRQILVDHARKRAAEKRGGSDKQRLSLTQAGLIAREQEVDVLALDEAMERLAAFDSQQARIVELKFFAGLTIEETAEVLNISHATIEREWKLARAWLRRELSA